MGGDRREDNLSVEDQDLAVVRDHHDIEKNMKTWEKKGEDFEAEMMKTADEHGKGEKNKVSETSEKKNNKVKFKVNFEPEIDNINIFRHHPHIAKSIKDGSVESGVES